MGTWFRVLAVVVLSLVAPAVAPASPATEGDKRLLVIRADFSDHAGDPVSSDDAMRVMRQVEAFYRENSWGRFTVTATVTPTVRVPLPVGGYTLLGQEIINDARDAARKIGFDTNGYEFDIVTWNTPHGGSGLGAVGGKGIRLASGFSYSGAVHELGHNLGLPHTRMWVPYTNVALGPGWTWDYGDPYDTMGGGADHARNHFSIRHKAVLGWLGEKGLTTVTESGTYRLYAHDTGGEVPDGAVGLKFPRNQRETYWVEFRQGIVENMWCMNGVRLHRSFSDNNECELIDAAPDSPHGRDDAALLIGRTYSDFENGVHVTPLTRFDTTPPSVDVVVNAGRFANNRPPVVRSLRAVEQGENGFEFRVDATDPNNDPLSYSWDFGDATFDAAKTRATHEYKERDRDYVVRCVVSDMKGGVASKSLVATVGRPRTHRIFGVVTERGRPIEGARVHVSAGHYVYTDSDGAFTLVGLETGEHRLTAYKWGHIFAPLRVNAPKGGPIRIEALPVAPASFAHAKGLVLETGDRLTLPRSFKPPVEITLEAKTDSTNLRLAYAADQLIFNWEVDGDKLLVEGGPAAGSTRDGGAGTIPANKYVTVKWYVTPKKQAVYVDGKLRFEHVGDYSGIDRPVSVFTHQAKVTVKSLRVKPM